MGWNKVGLKVGDVNTASYQVSGGFGTQHQPGAILGQTGAGSIIRKNT